MTASAAAGYDWSQIFLAAVIVLAAWRLSRGGAGSAVSELSEANKVLTKKTEEQGALLRDLKAQNEKLEERTRYADYFSKALEPLSHLMRMHEERAQERHKADIASHEKQLQVLDLMAARLGPDHEHEGDDR